MNHEERISPSSDPRLVAEHETRYRFARGAIELAATWCDLGCGTAAGSSLALSDALPERVLLVDVNEQALAEAARNLGGTGIQQRRVDLTSPTELAELGAALDDLPGPRVLTCFEVIEHLPTIAPLLEFLSSLDNDDTTVVISAPNDVFSGVTNPYHVTAWGDSTFDELLQFLPQERVVATQVVVEGTSILGPDGQPVAGASPRPLGHETPPFAFLVAFGPLADRLTPVTSTSVVDAVNQRLWESQRAVDLEYYRRRLAEVEAELAELQLQSPDT